LKDEVNAAFSHRIYRTPGLLVKKRLPTPFPFPVLIFMADSATDQSQRNKMMLGFIVRRCARDIGHPPTPEEFAEWANNQEDNGRRYSLFGHPISASAARIILRHPGRMVTARLEAIVRGLR